MLKGLTTMVQKGHGELKDWFERGYNNGFKFAAHEADYDELAAVYRAGDIPPHWDIFRAEIINKHLKDKSFDFQAYASGFARACMEYFEKI
jgi:hypothetical protein